jgi:16S rRNA (guanine527-N7)-methyltransferase
VFPKGRDADREIAEARQTWAFDCRKVPSRTDADASILIITELRRAA